MSISLNKTLIISATLIAGLLHCASVSTDPINNTDFQFFPPCSNSNLPCIPHGLTYNGGPIMSQPIQVYPIWYGEWPGLLETEPLISNFINSIGSSEYWKILQQYCEFDGRCVTNQLFYLPGIQIHPTNTSLPNDQVIEVINNLFDTGIVSASEQNIYMILGSPEITQGDTCITYCADHFSYFYKSLIIKAIYIQSPISCPALCVPYQSDPASITPNQDYNSDTIIPILAHELAETVTDPQPSSGWENPIHPSTGGEVGDLCLWSFGTTYLTANGARANLRLNGVNFLTQQLWVNQGVGYCGLSPDH